MFVSLVTFLRRCNWRLLNNHTPICVLLFLKLFVLVWPTQHHLIQSILRQKASIIISIQSCLFVNTINDDQWWSGRRPPASNTSPTYHSRNNIITRILLISCWKFGRWAEMSERCPKLEILGPNQVVFVHLIVMLRWLDGWVDYISGYRRFVCQSLQA